MLTQSPILIRLSPNNKLLLELSEVYLILLRLLLLLFILLRLSFLVLFDLLMFLAFSTFFIGLLFHCIYNIIIYHPDIILVISSNRLSCVSPIIIIIVLAFSSFLVLGCLLRLLHLRNWWLLFWFSYFWLNLDLDFRLLLFNDGIFNFLYLLDFRGGILYFSLGNFTVIHSINNYINKEYG